MYAILSICLQVSVQEQSPITARWHICGPEITAWNVRVYSCRFSEHIFCANSKGIWVGRYLQDNSLNVLPSNSFQGLAALQKLWEHTQKSCAELYQQLTLCYEQECKKQQYFWDSNWHFRYTFITSGTVSFGIEFCNQCVCVWCMCDWALLLTFLAVNMCRDLSRNKMSRVDANTFQDLSSLQSLWVVNIFLVCFAMKVTKRLP